MPSIAIPVSLRGQLLSGARPTLTNILFSANEPGFTFEPWDITTLYQDRAGTTPVTAAGQSVGLRLSKDQGLRVGPEQSANPGSPFTSTAGFTAATSTISLVAGRIKTFIPAATSGAAGIYWDTTVTANKAQKIVMDIEAEGRTFEVRIYNGASFATLLATDTISAGVRRNVSFTVTPTTSAVRVYILEASGADRSVYLASVSVREIAGNHQVAVSDAKRGVYGWMPKTGRRNLLTYTEQFDNAVWSARWGGSATVSPNDPTFLAPDGTQTVDKVTATLGGAGAGQAIALTSGVTYTFSCWVNSPAAASDLRIATAATGGGIVALASIPSSASLVRYSLTYTPSVTQTYYVGVGNSLALQTVYIWGAQLEVGSTATAYQRVVSQYDITEAGVPTCYYVQADGVDDAYVTPTITPNTDKAQVFAGVRKLSDAAQGALIELSASPSGNNGTITVNAPGDPTTARYNVFARLSSASEFAGVESFPAPINNVVSALFDCSKTTVGGLFTVRVDGTQRTLVNKSADPVAPQSILAYPAYIYSRGGTSFPFNGLDFGHAVRFGPNLDAATIARVESLIARNTPEVTL